VQSGVAAAAYVEAELVAFALGTPSERTPLVDTD